MADAIRDHISTFKVKNRTQIGTLVPEDQVGDVRYPGALTEILLLMIRSDIIDGVLIINRTIHVFDIFGFHAVFVHDPQDFHVVHNPPEHFKQRIVDSAISIGFFVWVNAALMDK